MDRTPLLIGVGESWESREGASDQRVVGTELHLQIGYLADVPGQQTRELANFGDG
jgi:hypothetical protein